MLYVRGISAIFLISIAASCISSPESPRPVADLVHPLDDANVIDYPWGWIRWLINAEMDPHAEMTFGVVHLNGEQTNPLHIHSNCEELLYVISGSCEHRIGDQWISIKKGDLVRIPAGIPHLAKTDKVPMLAVIVYSSANRDFTALGEEDQQTEY